MSCGISFSTLQLLPMTGIALTYGLTTGSWVGLLLGGVGLVMITAGLFRLWRGERSL